MLHDSLVSNRSHRSCSIIFSELREFQPRKVNLWREKSCLPKFRFPDLVNKNRGCLVWMGYACPKLFTVYQSERKLKVSVAQSCPTLNDHMDHSPLVFSVYGILQARFLEWIAIPFSRGYSDPRIEPGSSCIAGRLFTIWVTRDILSLNNSLFIWNSNLTGPPVFYLATLSWVQRASFCSFGLLLILEIKMLWKEHPRKLEWLSVALSWLW